MSLAKLVVPPLVGVLAGACVYVDAVRAHYSRKAAMLWGFGAFMLAPVVAPVYVYLRVLEGNDQAL